MTTPRRDEPCDARGEAAPNDAAPPEAWEAGIRERLAAYRRAYDQREWKGVRDFLDHAERDVARLLDALTRQRERFTALIDAATTYRGCGYIDNGRALDAALADARDAVERAAGRNQATHAARSDAPTVGGVEETARATAENIFARFIVDGGYSGYRVARDRMVSAIAAALRAATDPARSASTCPECNGSGRVREEPHGEEAAYTHDCGACDGSGVARSAPPDSPAQGDGT